MIHTIDAVRSAYVKALVEHPDASAALDATARALGLSAEAVHLALTEEEEAD